ncbi:MAG TPA: glycoside hydrolase family 3 N-terminal domain-containing protein [Flavobacteriales bacterium]|nr:glycoside hydrolase family 3 N-terminal domain-containing protein [Flavobacteriales bacterium]
MERKAAIALVLLVTALSLGNAQSPSGRTINVPPFLERTTPWADSVFSTLSMEQRIGQLMMIAAYSDRDAKHEKEVETLISEKGIGGIIFFKGGPHRQAKLTNRFQAAARTPLLIGMDLEWGLAMRLDSTIQFPRQMALGALRSDTLIEAMGLEIAREMERLGIHVSFSPVVDVNNNPANPVINDRSFGEDREAVARKGIAYMRGLQRGGVIATAKHFPGHGDTDTDSHKALPVIAHGRARLDSVELYPFKRLVDEGLAAMMIAHLEVPALDSAKGVPSTLSKPIVTGILENELGFHGLVFTDALNMQGVAKADKPGEVELRALLAGNDVMLFPIDPAKAIARIKLAVDSGEVDSALIDRKCLKILRAKEWAGLASLKPIATKDLNAGLNSSHGNLLRRNLYARAITAVNDHHGILPIGALKDLRIASVVIGDTMGNPFQVGLQRYAPVELFRCDKSLRKDSLEVLLRQLEKFDRVIVSVHNTSWRLNKDFGVPQSAMDIVREIAARKKTIFGLFANPYVLAKASGGQLLASTLVAYEETEETQDLMAQAIFGAISVDGRLPVTASPFFKLDDGLQLKSNGRFTYTMPEELGMSGAALKAIDDVVAEGMKATAYPGCEVLVAVDGQVIMNKAYGYTTYANARKVRPADIYDLASVTKVASTTLALMRLVDEDKLDLDKEVGDYLPEVAELSKEHGRIELRDILTHQAGLKAYVPFYTKLLKDGKLRKELVSDSATTAFPVRVAQGMYIPQVYADSMVTWVVQTPLAKRGTYLYSDMGYYLLQAIVERLSGMPLDRSVSTTFYAPMGASTLGYKPWERFSLDRIAPTELDNTFRQRQIQGDVHDPGAAMKGGVAGHAGLFSNANDLAMIMQMLVNGGTYGGTRYLSDKVVKEFTKCQFCSTSGTGNRRGLGWDKPVRGNGGPTCDCVSYASFGHTGFTGTMAWADPESKVVYVFLSNRVFPDATTNKLASMGIRTRIQEVVHGAVADRVKPERMSTTKLLPSAR